MTFIIVSRACTIGIKAFSAPHTTPAVTGLGVHEELGGDTAGTAAPGYPKGHSIPYSFMLSVNISWGRRRMGHLE